ncbi:MAG TPA: hypothetical protein VFS43_24855 [Polyangiaceae bacterium]|nr:hypothetical protein [Polyangiaceae bacterium]
MPSPENDAAPRAITVAPKGAAPRAIVVAPKAKPPALIPAPSLAEAKPGELLLLDGRGNVVGPRQLALVKARSWGLVGLMVGGVGLLYAAMFGPAAGAAVAAFTAAAMGFQLRHWPAFRAAHALVANYQWEEAHAAFVALESKALPRGLRVAAAVTQSALDGLLGRAQSALERLDRVLPKLRGSWAGGGAVQRWRAGCLRAAALARLGRLDEARRQRDEVATWARGRGARGEFYAFMLESLELTIAVEADAPHELPDDATLHQWARGALLRTQYGEMLVSLAWAFHRRGDDAMARHLLAEAPSRMPRYSLHVTAPRLHAWAEERRAAWSLGEGGGEEAARRLLGP